MDFLTGKIKTIYMKYLLAAFGSAMITSIYSIVDMVCYVYYWIISYGICWDLYEQIYKKAAAVNEIEYG